MKRFLKIAHRGASGHFPENTRIAFQKAIEAGADMIETDCQLTKDARVVAFHDERLNRTAGVDGSVKPRTLAQLKQLEVGGWRDGRFIGERIPTLEEVLDLAIGKTELCLEIKQREDSPPGIELKIVSALRQLNYLDHTIVSSFHYHCLERVRQLAQQARIGVVYGMGVTEDPFRVAQRIGAASIHIQKETASRHLLERAWGAGLDAYVWTVNDLDEMRRLRSLGVQGIISDFPEKLAKLARKSHRKSPRSASPPE
jgi:glycerophosphoryl diester phosphodiesterase